MRFSPQICEKLIVHLIIEPDDSGNFNVMKENRIVYILILILSMLSAGYVIVFYWMNNTHEKLIELPMDVFVALMMYVLLQIGKRQWFVARNWWDWLYYIGLLTAVLPTFLGNAENISTFSLVAKLGAFFLLLPIVMDGKSWLNESK